MCLAVPSRVVAVDGLTATVEAFGQRRQVSLMLIEADGGAAIGDYLLIQAGGFAFERIEPARAEEALALIGTLLENGGDGRRWGSL